jgi:hypothetical protein
VRAGVAIWHAGAAVTIPSYRKTKEKQRLFGPEFASQGSIDAPRNRAAVRRSDLRPCCKFQRVENQRYFDAAGFPGRTLGLEAEAGKQKTAGK